MPEKNAQRSRNMSGNRITAENVTVPGYTISLDAAMYLDMRQAVMKVLPPKPPRLTQSEIRQAVLPRLPKTLFPGGAKAGWWAKVVQLDLEAKKVLAREMVRPLRWHRKSGSGRTSR